MTSHSCKMLSFSTSVALLYVTHSVCDLCDGLKTEQHRKIFLGYPPDNAPPIADLMHCASENSNKTLTNVFAGHGGDLSNSKVDNEGNKEK